MLISGLGGCRDWIAEVKTSHHVGKLACRDGGLAFAGGNRTTGEAINSNYWRGKVLLGLNQLRPLHKKGQTDEPDLVNEDFSVLGHDIHEFFEIHRVSIGVKKTVIPAIGGTNGAHLLRRLKLPTFSPGLKAVRDGLSTCLGVRWSGFSGQPPSLTS